MPDTLCVKVSRRIDAWIREAYFGQLLADHPRAIALYDAFVVTAADGTPLYCLALEYARQGDLSALPAAHRPQMEGDRSHAGRSPASCRSSASCIAASCCIAT